MYVLMNENLEKNSQFQNYQCQVCEVASDFSSGFLQMKISDDTRRIIQL